MLAFILSRGRVSDWGEAFLGFPPFGALCIVAALFVGLAGGMSSFFPSLGLSFCYVVGVASLISAVVLPFAEPKEWTLAIVCLILVVELVICCLILRALSSRMRRRRLQK